MSLPYPPAAFWYYRHSEVCWTLLDDTSAYHRALCACCIEQLGCQHCGESPFFHMGRDLRCLYSATEYFKLRPEMAVSFTSMDVIDYMRYIPKKPAAPPCT